MNTPSNKNQSPKDVCKKCKMYREEHYSPWKITDCKFEELADTSDLTTNCGKLPNAEDNLRKEIEAELQKGIRRNKVLPLDWAMNRINPIIGKGIKQAKAEMLKNKSQALIDWKDKEVEKAKSETLKKVFEEIELIFENYENPEDFDENILSYSIHQLHKELTQKLKDLETKE